MAFSKEIMCHSIPSQIFLVVVVKICIAEQFGDILDIYIARRRLNIRPLIKFYIARIQSLSLFLAGNTCCLSHKIV